MDKMFLEARTFNCDLSKWDVSSVTDMDYMFFEAKSFKQKLCGTAWINSKATKLLSFSGSPGSISQTKCASVQTLSTLATRQYASRRQPERELIVRKPIKAPVNTPAIASTIIKTMMCPKCGTFEKSARNSCCAPGGAWYENCAGAGNKNVNHKWFEGVAACKRKFKNNNGILSIHSHSD